MMRTQHEMTGAECALYYALGANNTMRWVQTWGNKNRLPLDWQAIFGFCNSLYLQGNFTTAPTGTLLGSLKVLTRMMARTESLVP